MSEGASHNYIEERLSASPAKIFKKDKIFYCEVQLKFETKSVSLIFEWKDGVVYRVDENGKVSSIIFRRAKQKALRVCHSYFGLPPPIPDTFSINFQYKNEKGDNCCDVAVTSNGQRKILKFGRNEASGNFFRFDEAGPINS